MRRNLWVFLLCGLCKLGFKRIYHCTALSAPLKAYPTITLFFVLLFYELCFFCLFFYFKALKTFLSDGRGKKRWEKCIHVWSSKLLALLFHWCMLHIAQVKGISFSLLTIKIMFSILKHFTTSKGVKVNKNIFLKYMFIS